MDNKDLDDMLRDIGQVVRIAGTQLASRERPRTPYDRFTVRELAAYQRSLKDCSKSIKEIKKTYEARYSN